MRPFSSVKRWESTRTPIDRSTPPELSIAVLAPRLRLPHREARATELVVVLVPGGEQLLHALRHEKQIPCPALGEAIAAGGAPALEVVASDVGRQRVGRRGEGADASEALLLQGGRALWRLCALASGRPAR